MHYYRAPCTRQMILDHISSIVCMHIYTCTYVSVTNLWEVNIAYFTAAHPIWTIHGDTCHEGSKQICFSFCKTLRACMYIYASHANYCIHIWHRHTLSKPPKTIPCILLLQQSCAQSNTFIIHCARLYCVYIYLVFIFCISYSIRQCMCMYILYRGRES